MSSESEETLPEATDLLERLYRVKTFEDVISLLNDIRNIMLKFIYKMEPDPAIRCDVLISFWRLMDAIYILLDSYAFAKKIPLPFGYDLRAEIVRSIKDIIDTYAVLRTGMESSAFAEHNFNDLLNLVRNDIANFYKNLEDYINELKEHKTKGFSRHFTEF
jgi:hypothetical protein